MFVQDHPHIRLRLFASRLYFHWRWKHQEGLRLLHTSGISVAVMRLQGRDRAELSGMEGFAAPRGKSHWGVGVGVCGDVWPARRVAQLRPKL